MAGENGGSELRSNEREARATPLRLFSNQARFILQERCLSEKSMDARPPVGEIPDKARRPEFLSQVDILYSCKNFGGSSGLNVELSLRALG